MTCEGPGVRVDTNEHVCLDIKLEVGQLVETITVSEGASLVRTTKRIPVNEKISLQSRCDVPNTKPTNSAFGFITSQTNEPRAIQMALRLVW